MSDKVIDQELFESIEAYLMEAMSEQERRGFEARLASDTDLQEEVARQRENMLAVELGAFSRTLSKVVAEGGQGEGPLRSQGTFLIGMTAWRIAAMLLLVLGISWWWMERKDVHDRILAEHSFPDPGLPVPMSASSDVAFHDAMVDYKVGKYDLAISKWSALLREEPGNDTLRYYLANAYSMSGGRDSAIALFEGLVVDTASVFAEKAEWRLFLSYIEGRERDKALAFQVAPSSTYAARIKEIQQMLQE